jgi:aspartyl-tRNA(Asn)/glutamyl-tRNA(Gln) amidotransferase subunit B
MSWQTVLGFEIHVELGTKSKMFCGCSADHFGKPANTQVCPVCLGLPGALPVPNQIAIEDTIKLGLALGCEINLFSKFDRKNYFYPDLPKGYQISQYDLPFCKGGQLELPSGKVIRITRVHLEEDTGKLQHSGNETLIDFNRSGVPLVEIVTEPDFDNPDDGTEFLKEIQQIVRTLEISTADMEKGSMRLEANVSVRPLGQTELPNFKTEIKNVNSFRFIKKAIEFDVQRQIQILESGQIPAQETRGFKESTGETVSQRSKEEAHDYRYFPEPDIPPLQFTKEQVELLRTGIPELPAAIRNRLVKSGVPLASAITIVSSAVRLEKFSELSKMHDPAIVAKMIVNTPEDKLSTLEITQSANETDEGKILEVAKKIVEENPKVVADIKSGKQQAMFFLIGQIKKELGSVDISTTKKIIEGLI